MLLLYSSLFLILSFVECLEKRAVHLWPPEGTIYDRLHSATRMTEQHFNAFGRSVVLIKNFDIIGRPKEKDDGNGTWKCMA